MFKDFLKNLAVLLCLAICEGAALASNYVIWVEGEDATSIPTGLDKKTLDKLPASGGKSLIGKSFGKKGNIITYNINLPRPMANAQMTMRYSRLHVMRWTAAEATITAAVGDTQVVKPELLDQSGGWGSLRGSEWTLHTVKFGDLPAGSLEIKITVQKDNSDLNLDGFFLSSGPLELSREDFGQCNSNHITSDGFVGLSITNTAIDQKDFPAIKIMGMGFGDKKTSVTVELLNENGQKVRTIASDIEIRLDSFIDSIEITPKTLAGISDGNYTLIAYIDGKDNTVSTPLVAMGQLLAQATAKADEYEQFAESLDKYGPEITKRTKADLVYAVDYIRNAIVLLKSRDGRYDANDSAHKIALSYFEKAVQRTAVNFTADIRGIIRQSDETIERIKAGKDPYLGRSGDLRRAFYSEFSGMLEPYRVLIPQSYWQAPDGSYKFLLALHGAGGDENYYPENDKGSFAAAANELGYLVAAPKGNLRYRNGGEKDLKQLVDIMQAEYPGISDKKLFCTGVSMGGGGTFRMALAYPDTFAACAIVSSGMRSETPPENFSNFERTPTLILHGKLDGVSPVENAYRLADELKKRGYIYDIEVYPRYGHAYNGEEYLRRSHKFFSKFIK